MKTVTTPEVMPHSLIGRSSRAVLLSILTILLSIFSSSVLQAQTYFSEDFESSFPGNFTIQGAGAQWQQNSTYSYTGSKSAWFQTSAGNTNTTLVSNAINLASAVRPQLTFNHIVGLERFYDQAYVEISTDNGVNWTDIPNSAYNGNSWRKTGSNLQSSASTMADGPFFDAQSRPDWDITFRSATATPTTGTGMWRKEVFDLSGYRLNGVKIRFRVKSNASNDFYGWLVDNVQVAEAPATRISGTRVIGAGGFSSFTTALNALADSGVGTGGVTFLVTPGTYTDSIVTGNWAGVSASNRVRFQANGGAVILQRFGSNGSISTPSTSTGYSYSYYVDAVLTMSGTTYTTFQGIDFAQQALGAGAYYTEVGVYMQNGCKNDSIYRCRVDLARIYYNTTGIMINTSLYYNGSNVFQNNNKIVDDTVSSWFGVMMNRYFLTLSFDSSNEVSGSAPGKATVTGGVNGTPVGTTTIYNICLYGQINCVVRNVTCTSTPYSGQTLTSYGIYLSGNLINPVIQGNKITGYGSVSSSIYAYSYGIYCPSSTVIRPQILNDTIQAVQGYGYYGIYMSSVVEPLVQGCFINNIAMAYYYYAMYTSSCIRPRIIGNKIKNVYNGAYGSGTTGYYVYGIYSSSNIGPVMIANNMMSDMHQLNSLTSMSVYGIYFIQGTGGPAHDSIIYNSIFLNGGTGTATSNNTYALYVSSINTAAGANLVVKNNILSNTLPLGASSTAYCEYYGTVTTNLISDFNDLYGPTGASDTIIHKTGYYGSPRGLIAQMVSAGLEQHSFSDNPPFTSDSLHVSTTTATRLARAGQYLSNMTTDYDGESRGTAPCIGADEAALTVSTTDDVAPAIQYTRILRSSSTSGITFNAVIGDPSGVNSSTYAPLLYYKAVGAGSWSSVTGSNSSGNNWSFAMPGYSAGTVVQYYFAAQDLASTPNGGTAPFGGTGTNPPGATAPLAPDTVRIAGSLNGDYLVGGAGAAFPTLKAGLDSLNVAGVSGPVRFLLNANSFTEGALVISGPVIGGSSTNTVTIKPNAGFQPVITTSATTNYFLLINGASNIIVDGSNSAGGTTRDLTWSGGSTYATIEMFIQPAFAVDGTIASVNNVTVKNCVLKPTVSTGTPNGSVTNTSYRGVQIQTSLSLPGASVSNVTIQNDSIANVYYGIVLAGVDLANQIHAVKLLNNALGGTADSVTIYGMNLAYCDSTLISGNNIQNMTEGTSTTSMYGIYLSTWTTNAIVTKNKVHNMWLNGTSGTVFGLYTVQSSNPTFNTYTNNFFYDLHARATLSGTSYTSPAVAGMFMYGGFGDLVAYNTIHLFDTSTTSSSASLQYTFAMDFYAYEQDVTVVNNIMSNQNIVGSAQGRNFATSLYYGSGQVALWNNNLYNLPGTKAQYGYFGVGSQLVGTFDSLKIMTGGDGRSVVQAPPFISATDPHINTAIPTRIESGGIPVAGVTTDIDGNTRNATTPDIGAAEGNYTPYYSTDIVLVNVNAPAQNAKYVAGLGVRPVVTIRNDGLQTAYSFTVTDRYTDSTTLSTNFLSSTIDSLRPNETRTITLDSLTFATAGHVYGLKFYANAATEGNRLNDSSSTIRVVAAGSLSGIYTVGVGRWAPTIKAAFDSLVNNGISGNVTFSLTDGLYNEPAITTGYIGNNGLILGANASSRLRIKPAAGVSPVVNIFGNTTTYVNTYYTTTSYCGLGLQNTRYLTIDGSNTENGTSRDMTLLIHPGANGSTHFGIVFNATQFDSIKNCVIQDSEYYSGMSGSGASDYGVLFSSPSGGAVPTSYNYLVNNWIRDDYAGVYAYGNSSPIGVNNVIANNKISRFAYYGIYCLYLANTQIIGNTITSDTAASVYYQYGIYTSQSLAGSGASQIVGNKIYKFRSLYPSTGYTFYGMYLNYSAVGPTNVINNVVALDHDTLTSDYMYGMYLYDGASYSSINLYYNTVYLGGSTSGYTGYALYYYYPFGDLENNIFVDNRGSSPYLISAYYNAPVGVWNNNLYFKSASGGQWGTYYNGSTYSYPTDLPSWRTAVGTDSKSWSESVPFVDSIGGNFALVTNVPTRVESHGTPIAGITTDINGNLRNTRYPDIGAYEGSYTTEFDVNMTAVSLDQPAANTRYFTNTIASAAATFKQSGLLTLANVPIVFQAVDPAGIVQASYSTSIPTAVPNTNNSVSGFSFIPLTPGTWTIRAFAVAPNEEWTIDDTVSTTIKVSIGMAGNYNIGVGQFAPTLKAAFDSVTLRGTIGAVNFTFTDNNYTEPPLTMNKVFGESASNPISFKPAVGVNPLITFNATAAQPWAIKLNSAKYFTFDGANTGNARSTTWQFNGPLGKVGFWVNDSIGSNGSTGFTLKNSHLLSGGTTAGYYGVYVGGNSIVTPTNGSNNSVTIQNNEIRNANIGLWVGGPSALSMSTGLTVSQNTVGPVPGDITNRIGAEGIVLSNIQSPIVSGNQVQGLYSTTGPVVGIDIGSSSGPSITGNEVRNAYSNAGNATGVNLGAGNSSTYFGKNKVHDLEAAGGVGTAVGLLDNGGASESTQILNNMIWSVISVKNASVNTAVNAGIYLGSVSGAQLGFNTIYLVGNRDTAGVGGAAAASAALYVTSTATSVAMRDNIFVSKQTESTRSAKSYGYVIEALASIASANNDDLFGVAKGAPFANVAGADFTRIANLRTAMGSGNESLGFTGDAPVNSPTDLHINPLTPSLVESGGVPYLSVTDDIDGNLRNLTTPDVGANEGNFTKAVDVVGVAINNPIQNAVFRPYGKTTAPIATFRNAAAGTGTSIPVTLSYYDSATSITRTSSKIIPSLGPGASAQVTFDSLILPDIGSYGLIAYSVYPPDVDNSNDTTPTLVVKICAPLMGDYYVGVGRDFPNLTVAVKTLSDCGIRNITNFWLTDNAYTEPAPIHIIAVSGSNSAFPIQIKPMPGIRPVTSIAVTGATPAFWLDSLSFVKLDGSNAANGTSRDWTIMATGVGNTGPVLAIYDGTGVAAKNLTLINSSMSAGSGITLQATRLRMSGTSITNNDVRVNAVGIQTINTFADSSLTISGNLVTRFGTTGILVGDMTPNVTIANNTVRSDTGAASVATLTGIQLNGASTTNPTINANFVGNMQDASTNATMIGIALNNVNASVTSVTNNMIPMDRSATFPTASIIGVQVNPGVVASLIGNSIAIGGSGVTAGTTYGVWSDLPASLTAYNNIIVNTRSNAVGANGFHYSFGSNRPPVGRYASDYNDLAVSGTGAVLGISGGSQVMTLPMWRMTTAATPYGMQDNNSFSELPNFLGATDLHINNGFSTRIESGGKPGLTTSTPDYDGDLRNWRADVGADEFNGSRGGRLSGTYTIGAGPYSTFSSFVAALNAMGVDGPIDVYLANGTETNGQALRFVAADGVSPTNYVHIHAAQGGSSTLIGSGAPYVIAFDSASHDITFDGDNGTTSGRRSLTIFNNTIGSPVNGSYSAVWVSDGSFNDIVQNANILTMPDNRTIQPSAAHEGGKGIHSLSIASGGWGVVQIVGGAVGNDVMNITFANDSIWNGWNGVYAAGYSASNGRVRNISITRSTVQDFYSTGVFFGAFTQFSSISFNRVQTSNLLGGDATIRGIRLSSNDADTGNIALANWVVNVRSLGGSNTTGIEVVDGVRPMIANNFISLDDYTTGSVRGIDESSSAVGGATNARILFNSINLYGRKNPTSQNDYAIAILNNDGVANGDTAMNNILGVQRVTNGPTTTYGYALSAINDLDISDYNDFYNPTGNAAMIGGVGYPTLSSLLVIPSWNPRDANSITADPKWKSNVDLHLANYNSGVLNKGFYLASVPNDIDNQGRDPFPRTEIGADENGAFGTLPVELVSLSATGLDSKIAIDWTTVNEKDVFGYALLRSEANDANFTELASALSERGLQAHGVNGAETNYSFADAKVKSGVTYFYKLVTINADGTRHEEAKIASAALHLATNFSIVGNYPNPFSLNSASTTIVTYSVGATSEVEIDIHDIAGRTIRTLVVDLSAKPGTYSVEWNGRDEQGNFAASGTYFLLMKAQPQDGGQGFTSTQKMVLTR